MEDSFSGDTSLEIKEESEADQNEESWFSEAQADQNNGSSEKLNVGWNWKDIQTDFDTSGFNSEEAWISPSLLSNTHESPGIWDPSAFEQQAPSSWKESKEPKRIQDIASPLLVEPEDYRLNSDEEEWPFKSPCKLRKKGRRRMGVKGDHNVASDIESEEEGALAPNAAGVDDGDETPSVPRTVSRDADEDEDIEEDKEEALAEAAKSKSSKGGSLSRRSSRKDNDPAMPRRSRRSDDEADTEIVLNDEGDQLPPRSSDLPRKPRRSRSKEEDIESDDNLDQGSFHALKKDFDKKPSRSNSSSRRARTPGSGGSGRRRRAKDKSMDMSGHSTGGDEDEIAEDEHAMKLKGEDDDTPGSGRKAWRERRAQNRLAQHGNQPLQAPGSGGSRRPRRAQMRRASSERWMRAVEGVEPASDGGDNSRSSRNSELSRSSHGVRRYHSGNVGRMSGSLGTASYHGMEGGSGSTGRRTPSRRPPRKAMSTPTSENSRSFGGEDYEYELNLSGRSARTLDSIEDLEDFEHIDFQTPGMIDYDEEMLELMQRANPEHTAQLQRRVGRKREAVNYDQNMPMMTRQALMTRTASTQVQRQYVDQSTIDRRRLLVRSMSGTSMGSTDELSMSQHRQQQLNRGPARRPPPRTRSSGMAALSRSEHPYGPNGPDRRGVFRAKSGTSTSSFRHNQKPNRVQSLSRRGPNDGPDSGGSGSRFAPEERRGSVMRAQSMHASLGRPVRSTSPRKPERRIPKSIETEEEKAKADENDDHSSSFSEDSDLETDDDDSAGAPQKITTKILMPPVPPKPPRKKTDKRDFTIKRNRAKLHSMLYELKMEVDMKDLLRQVQEGEVPRSPIKTLMMPSP